MLFICKPRNNRKEKKIPISIKNVLYERKHHRKSSLRSVIATLYFVTIHRDQVELCNFSDLDLCLCLRTPSTPTRNYKTHSFTPSSLSPSRSRLFINTLISQLRHKYTDYFYFKSYTRYLSSKLMKRFESRPWLLALPPGYR